METGKKKYRKRERKIKITLNKLSKCLFLLLDLMTRWGKQEKMIKKKLMKEGEKAKREEEKMEAKQRWKKKRKKQDRKERKRKGKKR